MLCAGVIGTNSADSLPISAQLQSSFTCLERHLGSAKPDVVGFDSATPQLISDFAHDAL